MQAKTIAILRSNPKDAALSRLIGSLAKIGRVDCFLWDRQGDFQPNVTGENIRYVKCGIRAGFYNLWTLLKLFLFQAWVFGKLLTARYDVVHAIDLDTGLPGYLAARLRRKKFIYQCLDPYYAILPKRWPSFLARFARYLENSLISHSDLFIITDQLRMPQHEGAHPRRVIEVPNVPILPDKLSPKPRNTGTFIVGYLGSLIEGRNLFTAIETCGELADQGVKLVIGGFGPLEKEIQKSAEAWPNITFKSWIPYQQMLQEEAHFDLFFHITDPKNEAQRWVSPNKLFEAMALGRPIIVGKDTLAAQKVENFQNGMCVNYDSHDQLRKAILRFKNNPDLSIKTGQIGFAEFERNWRYDLVENRMLTVYKDVLKVLN